MGHKLFKILCAVCVSGVTLSGCIDEGAYRYPDARMPTIYREQVVIERREYYGRQGASYYHRGRPQDIYVQSGDRRSPRCFGTNCYVGATYREDPYYRLTN
jgi:hypothetical protein